MDAISGNGSPISRAVRRASGRYNVVALTEETLPLFIKMAGECKSFEELAVAFTRGHIMQTKRLVKRHCPQFSERLKNDLLPEQLEAFIAMAKENASYEQLALKFCNGNMNKSRRLVHKHCPEVSDRINDLIDLDDNDTIAHIPGIKRNRHGDYFLFGEALAHFHQRMLAGQSVDQVAQFFSVSPPVIHRWRDKYLTKEEIALATPPREIPAHIGKKLFERAFWDKCNPENAALVVDKLFECALQGYQWAIEQFLNRAIGKPGDELKHKVESAVSERFNLENASEDDLLKLRDILERVDGKPAQLPAPIAEPSIVDQSKVIEHHATTTNPA